MSFTLDTGTAAGARCCCRPTSADAAPSAAAATPSARWKIPASRVLVVDDGAENRELVSLVLAEQGLWVEEAENGQVALDKVAAGGVRPDPDGHADAGDGWLTRRAHPARAGV